MPSLDDLPDEILLRIFRGLSQHDKASATRTSRKVSHAATTTLYETPELSIQAESDDENQVIGTRTMKLLRTVSTVPRLACMVRALRKMQVVTLRPIRFCEEDQNILAAALCGLQGPGIPSPSEIDQVDWSTDLPLTLLLLHCCAVQEVGIGFAQLFDDVGRHRDIASFESTTVFRIMKIAVQPSATLATQPLLASLKSLTLCGAHRPCETSVVLPVVFALPALKRLLLLGVREQETAESWTCRLEVSSITVLVFHNCKIKTETINKPILSCKALRRFEFTRLCRRCRPGLGTIDFASLYNALRKHSHTLEQLVLHSFNKCDHLIAYQDRPFKTLAELHALRLLRIAGHSLFATGDSERMVHLLPPRLDGLFLDLVDPRTRVLTLHQAARLCLRYTHTMIWAETHRYLGRTQIAALRARYPTIACFNHYKKRLIRLQSTSQISVPFERIPFPCRL